MATSCPSAAFSSDLMRQRLYDGYRLSVCLNIHAGLFRQFGKEIIRKPRKSLTVGVAVPVQRLMEGLRQKNVSFARLFTSDVAVNGMRVV